MSKPDWKDAPEWAKWLAQDWNGRWYWYQGKPRAYTIRWGSPRGSVSQAMDRYSGVVVKNWRETLERRP